MLMLIFCVRRNRPSFAAVNLREVSEPHVKEFLMQFYDNIINNIEKVQGKVELGLKVMIKEPAEPSPDDANGEEEKPDGSLTPAREYLMARIREEKKQQKILEETGKSIDEICHTLSVYSDETCVRKLTTEIMILNASFLVDKNKVTFRLMEQIIP